MHTLEGAVQYPPNCNKMCVKKRLILPILLVSSQNRLTNWLFGMKLHTSQYKSAMSWLLWLWYYLQSAIMVHHSFPFYSMSKSFIYNNSRGKKKSGGRVAQGVPSWADCMQLQNPHLPQEEQIHKGCGWMWVLKAMRCRPNHRLEKHFLGAH